MTPFAFSLLSPAALLPCCLLPRCPASRLAAFEPNLVVVGTGAVERDVLVGCIMKSFSVQVRPPSSLTCSSRIRNTSGSPRSGRMWSIGVLGRFAYAPLTYSSGPATAKYSTIAPALMASFTFH